MKKVVSVENMRLSDRYTIENITPSKILMYNAGYGIYKSVSWQGEILVVCGKGNNAGDGYVVAELLSKGGHSVKLLLLDNSFSSDGEYYFNKCREAGVPYSIYGGGKLPKADIILDCIFGTGFSGDVKGKARELIEEINKSGAYVVSADINSGLNGDSGIASVCVKSDLTVAIGEYKSGHFLGMAKDKIKGLTLCPIGIEIREKSYHLIEERDACEFLKNRENFSNKGSYGYVALIGGSLEYSGAIKLAAISCAALRSGCGVAKIVAPKSICHSILPYILESTICPINDTEGCFSFNEEEFKNALTGIKAVAIGMGMGQRGDNEKIISYILNNCQIPVIIDADGLNTLSKMDMEILNKTKCKVVLTPHLKEFERLSKIPMENIQENPIHYAKEFAKKTNTVLLLKGTCTIVTDGDEVILSNTGCAGMATAGSGDVLSGILCALCARNDNLPLSVSVGAYINGIAGEIAQSTLCDISMTAGDTARSVGIAISKLKQAGRQAD